MDRIIYVEVEREGINISTQQTLCISAGDLFLPQIVQELHPVVGGEFPPARSLQDPDITRLGLGRFGRQLTGHLATVATC